MQQLLKGKKTNFVQAPWGRWFAVAGGDKLSMIRELREKSGSPIAEVKAALDEADYNLGDPIQSLSLLYNYLSGGQGQSYQFNFS